MLSDIVIAEAVIPYHGQDIRLQPLSLEDIRILVMSHMPTLARVALPLLPDLQSNDPTRIQISIARLIGEASALVADTIARAAGEPEASDIAARLPAPVQIRAVRAIAELTLEGVELADIVNEINEAALPVGELIKDATKH